MFFLLVDDDYKILANVNIYNSYKLLGLTVGDIFLGKKLLFSGRTARIVSPFFMDEYIQPFNCVVKYKDIPTLIRSKIPAKRKNKFGRIEIRNKV